jgi:hypothetical protein
MLLHRHEHSCYTVMLWTACSLSLLSNLVVLATFLLYLVLFQQTMWCNVYWCPISCMHTWILFPIVYGFVWPLYIICKFKLNYYLQFCDQSDPVPVMKLISNLWWIDVIFVTKVMTNLWPFYIKRWRWQISLCDDLNMYSMTILNLWCQLPRHWWRHRHVICQRGVQQTMTKTKQQLWPNRIVTKSLTALTATSVSQADVKLWRKQGIIYDQKHLS